MSDGPKILIVGGRGRPRSHEEKSVVSAWIPATQQKMLAQIADEGSTTVSALLGKAVAVICKAAERRKLDP